MCEVGSPAHATPCAESAARSARVFSASRARRSGSARAMRTEWLAARLRRLTDEQMAALESALAPLALLLDDEGAA